MKRVSIQEKEKINATDLLSIQKLVYLLDDTHYDLFHDELLAVKAPLSAKLLDTIKTSLPALDSHEELCRKMYANSSASSKASFNQLTAYTFRLSEYLAINHPSYLSHNMARIQDLIYRGKREEADFIADILLSLAEKIEDFTTQIQVLKFLIQQEHLFRKYAKAEQYYHDLETALENERIVNMLTHKLKHELNISRMSKKVKEKDILEHIEWIKPYTLRSSKVISLMSSHMMVYMYFFYRFDLTAQADLKSIITDMEKELNNHSYILFPYLFDIKSNLHLIKINSDQFEIMSRAGADEQARFNKHRNMVRFWNSYLNLPELYYLLIQASGYLFEYVYLLYRQDYPSLVPEKEIVKIKELIAAFAAIHQKYSTSEEHIVDMITLTEFKAGLMMALGGDSIGKGIEEIETLIISFQQIKKSRSGNAYQILMLGYFAQGNYQKCFSTYQRFMKIGLVA